MAARMLLKSLRHCKARSQVKAPGSGAGCVTSFSTCSQALHKGIASRHPRGKADLGKTIKIGNRLVGDGKPCFVIAQLGVNHNGDIDLAQKLIAGAALSNCDAVKLQKRTVDVVYSPAELNRPLASPFGLNYRDLHEGLELGQAEYEQIAEHCRKHSILWFASAWDIKSVDFLAQFNPPCYKIASPCLTNDQLLKHHRQYHRPILLSTGMSTMEEIDHAVELLGTENLLLMHCNSSYPARPEELNLRMIQTLKDRYKVPVGYSGHEVGWSTTIAAVALGACCVERHITSDRHLWGREQADALTMPDLCQLVRDICTVEMAQGDGVKRIYDSERPMRKSSRRVG